MATQAIPQVEDKPNGPVAAALLAGGIGAAVLGIMVPLTEAVPAVKTALTFSWASGVGPLAGKTTVGIMAFFLSWIILHFVFRGKETNFTRMATIAFVLLAIGLIGTFPPFFELFTAP
jgi:hypothetical protein